MFNFHSKKKNRIREGSRCGSDLFFCKQFCIFIPHLSSIQQEQCGDQRAIRTSVTHTCFHIPTPSCAHALIPTRFHTHTPLHKHAFEAYTPLHTHVPSHADEYALLFTHTRSQAHFINLTTIDENLRLFDCISESKRTKPSSPMMRPWAYQALSVHSAHWATSIFNTFGNLKYGPP